MFGKSFRHVEAMVTTLTDSVHSFNFLGSYKKFAKIVSDIK